MASMACPPRSLDLVELHDAFAIEAMGQCESGPAAALRAGEFDISGRVACGVGQIAELTPQLHGEADGRRAHSPATGSGPSPSSTCSAKTAPRDTVIGRSVAWAEYRLSWGCVG
jgi:hypothetical protein